MRNTLLALVAVGALGGLAYFKFANRACDGCEANDVAQEVSETDNEARTEFDQDLPATEVTTTPNENQEAPKSGTQESTPAAQESVAKQSEESQAPLATSATANDEAKAASASTTTAKTVVLATQKFTAPPKRGRVRSCIKSNTDWFIGGRHARDYVWRINNKDADDSFLMLKTKIDQPKGPIVLSHCAPFDPQSGSKLLFTTNIKLTDVGEGSYAFIRGVDESLVNLGAMQTHFSGTQDWQDVSVEFTVPDSANDVVFGLQLNAQGTLRVRRAELSAQ